MLPDLVAGASNEIGGESVSDNFVKNKTCTVYFKYSTSHFLSMIFNLMWKNHIFYFG